LEVSLGFPDAHRGSAANEIAVLSENTFMSLPE